MDSQIGNRPNKTHGEQIILEHLRQLIAVDVSPDEMLIGCDCKATSHVSILIVKVDD